MDEDMRRWLRNTRQALVASGSDEKENLLAVDFYCEKVKMALIGDPTVSPDDGLRALSWLKLYIAKMHSGRNDLEREINEYQELLAKITPKR